MAETEKRYHEKGYSEAEVEILVKLEGLTQQVKTLSENAEKYMPRAEFEARFDPIQKIVYGLVGVLLLTIVMAVAASVLK